MTQQHTAPASGQRFEELIEALCAYFELELERQETVLALCQAQGRAARAHDAEYLEANTEALAKLMQEVVRAEQGRLAVVQALVALLALPPKRQTLSSLIALATEPWGQRLAFYQDRLQDVLARIRTEVRKNAPILRRSLHIVNKTMQTLECCAEAAGGYDARGEEGGPGASPNIIDRRG